MTSLVSGITAIPPVLYESASLDGAGALRRFFRIMLPNLMPTLFTATVLSLLNSFKVFREAYLIAGSYPHESIYMLQHVFNNWFTKLDIDNIFLTCTQQPEYQLVLPNGHSYRTPSIFEYLLKTHRQSLR